MENLTTLLVSGIPLLVVIFGLVEFSKRLGLQGNWLLVFSLFLGLLFGIAYKVSETGFPVGFGAWFGMIVFGLALGLITSGLYDFADSRMSKTGP